MKFTRQKFENWSLKIGNFREAGMSLLEILVVVAIFAVLGIIVTRSIILTLQGSRKSESSVKVRENLDYAVSVMTRQLRNANLLTLCPNVDTTLLNYTDKDGNPSTFSCINTGSSNSYIASGSARLTNDNVNIVTCSFACQPGVSANPPVVLINLQGQDALGSGAEKSSVTVSTQIFLRSY